MECIFCKKIFSTLSSLNYHKTTAKYCLTVVPPGVRKAHRRPAKLFIRTLPCVS